MKLSAKIKRPEKGEAGSILLPLLLLLSFALTIALPVLRFVNIEYLAGSHQQRQLAARYLAEAGLAKARQHMRYYFASPLPDGELSLGAGHYRVYRQADNCLRANGRVGQAKVCLGLNFHPRAVGGGYLLAVQEDLSLAAGCTLDLVGNALVEGDIDLGRDSSFTIQGNLSLGGEVRQQGCLAAETAEGEPAPELWLWLEEQLLQEGHALPPAQEGIICLYPGLIYEWEPAAGQLQLLGPQGEEAAATVIVRGDLEIKNACGNINFFIAGDCCQSSNAHDYWQTRGVLWARGNLKMQNAEICGALAAGSLDIVACGGNPSCLRLAPFPGMSAQQGLVVPQFRLWNYIYE